MSSVRAPHGIQVLVVNAYPHGVLDVGGMPVGLDVNGSTADSNPKVFLLSVVGPKFEVGSGRNTVGDPRACVLQLFHQMLQMILWVPARHGWFWVLTLSSKVSSVCATGST